MADGSTPSVGSTILDLWAAGKTSTAIADIVGREPGYVWRVVRHARDNGDKRAIPHPSGNPEEWGDENITKFKRLWADGLSCPEIATAMGEWCTKNAVIGKARRLGLPARQEPRRGNPRPHRERSDAPRKTRAPRRPSLVKKPLPKPIAIRAVAGQHFSHRQVGARVAAYPESKNIPLLELTNRQCKFMAGDPRDPQAGFCGHRNWSGFPYCEAHARLAYTPESLRGRA